MVVQRRPEAAPERPRYPIESVDNALRLLLMLRERKLIRVSEAARDLGIAPSTAHRLLAMLVHYGFVRHDPATRGYLAGQALVDVGLAAVRHIDIRQHARPYLERLSNETGETVHLTVIDGENVLFLDAVECSRQALRASERTGTRLPVNCTASGKAILAEMTSDEVAEALPNGKRLPGLTDQSIVRRSDLEEELSRIRERGYAINLGESEPGISAVAAAVPTGLVAERASIVITAPSSRVDEEWFVKTGDAVVLAARALGDTLGQP